MKKLLMSLLAVTPLFLAACGNNNGADDVVADDSEETVAADVIEVDFWHAMTGVHGDALDALLDAFHAENPHIHVNAVFQGSYAELTQGLMANAVSNTLPHIAQAVTATVTQFRANDFILNLDEFFNDPEIGLSEEDINDIIPIFREAAQWDGSWYSVPFGKSTRILFYNADLLEEYGFEVPTSWDEIIAISEVLTNVEENRFGMGFENAFDSEFYALLEQFGGTYINEETFTAEFASEAGINAFGFMLDLLENNKARLAGEDRFMSGVFGREDVAMYIGSSAGLPHVANAVGDQFTFGTAILPTYNGVGATLFAGNDAVIFDAGTTEEQRAAFEFLAFTLQPEVTAQWAIDSGYIPVRYSAKELPFFVEYLEANPVHRAASDQFEYGFITARVEGASAVRNVLLDALEDIILGRTPIEEGLQAAEDAANEILARYNN